MMVLPLVIIIHELGHFGAAKAFGVAVDRFSMGFGRAIWSWTDKTGVNWRLGWIPLGGYVRFAGDVNEASVPDQAELEALKHRIQRTEGSDALQRYYHFKPVWQRAMIAAAGPLANFALAIAIFTILMSAVGEVNIRARVSGIVPGGAGEAAGFRPGDIVLRADHHPIENFDDLKRYVSLRAAVPIRFDVDRNGQPVQLIATPRLKEVNDKIAGRQKVGLLGLEGRPRPEDITRTRYNPIEAIPHAISRTGEIIGTTAFYLGRIFTGQAPADQIGGVVGIVHASGAVTQAAAESTPDGPLRAMQITLNLLSLSAVLSVSVGLLNLLPIPTLDGGHLLFCAYEAVARKPLSLKVQAIGYRAGLALLVGFMLFATWNDLHRYDVFKFLGGLFS